MKLLKVLLVFSVSSLPLFATKYVDLSKVNALSCRSASGITMVTVYRNGEGFNLSVLQSTPDGTRIIIQDQYVDLFTAESFPPQYSFSSPQNGRGILSLSGADLAGTVEYDKDGRHYVTPVRCTVAN